MICIDNGFPLAGENREKINITDYDKNRKRIFGYLAEVLMDIYIQKNNIRIKTFNLLNLDEIPGPISFKRRLWLFKENIFAILGAPAWGSGYHQRHAQFKHFKKRKGYSYDSESLCSYFQAIGSEITSQHEDHEGNINIYA